MKQTSLADKYQGQTIDNMTLSSILKDLSTGITDDVIKNRYKLKMSQLLEVKTYFKEITGPSRKKQNEQSSQGRLELSNFQAKTGARRQGLNEVCLCGSGRKYGSCCAKK